MIKAYAAKEPGGLLEPFEYDPGVLGTGQVEIKVEHCGICHSDLSMLDNAWEMSQYPIVPGHEVVGIISDLGSDVAHLKKGQRVGLGWHSNYCMSCESCQQGDHNLCSAAQGTIVGHHGGFADKVRASATSVIPLPEGLDPQKSGPLFCGGITVFNPLVQFQIKPTERVAVIGIGGLGHLALQFSRAWGCSVTAFTSSEDKREEALSMGAHEVINSRDSKQIEAAAGRFDLILSTVNVGLDWTSYLSTLRPKGRLHFLGAPLEPVQIMPFMLVGAQRSVSGSPVGSPATIARMLEFAARHKIEPTIESFPMAEVNQALQHLRDGKARYRIVLNNQQ